MKMNQATLKNIFKTFSIKIPNPKTELEYKNIFTLAIAVILSAQATDISVNKATKNLFEKYTTPEEFLELGEEGLKEYIKTIGLYNAKAKNIIALCKILMKEYNSQIPENFELLIKLPGIGRKTANVILGCGFGHPTIAVDTHVFRVSNRIGLADGKTPEQVEKQLLKKIPDKWKKYAHHWLILHGRYICKAKKPLCDICFIKNSCKNYLHNS